MTLCVCMHTEKGVLGACVCVHVTMSTIIASLKLLDVAVLLPACVSTVLLLLRLVTRPSYQPW